MVVVFAAYLANRQAKIKSPWTIIGALLILVPPWVLVMMQPDLGTSLVLVATITGLLFMSGASLFWLGTLAAAVVAAIPFVWNTCATTSRHVCLRCSTPEPIRTGRASRSSRRRRRSWREGGRQGPDQRQRAAARFDYGLRLGVLAEELGFIGGMVVLLLFALLIWRVLVCAWRANDPFAMLIGSGIATVLFFQVFVNVGMVIGLKPIPVTGIPLPFISYGGASLVSLAAGLGTLQSTNLRREMPQW